MRNSKAFKTLLSEYAETIYVHEFSLARDEPYREQGIRHSWVEEWSLKAKELGLHG